MVKIRVEMKKSEIEEIISLIKRFCVNKDEITILYDNKLSFIRTWIEKIELYASDVIEKKTIHFLKEIEAKKLMQFGEKVGKKQ